MDDKERQKEAYVRNIEQARIAHESRRKDMSETYAAVGSFSNAGMRAPAVAGAGGIAGILGFFSANAALLRNSEAVVHFNSALVAFFLAILICVAAPGLAYLSKSCFSLSVAREKFHWDPPYVRETPVSDRWHRVGVVLQWLTIGLVTVAILALIFGTRQFLRVADYAARAGMNASARVSSEDHSISGIAKVKDGDGILFGQIEIRLQGIAAPEDRRGARDPGGQESSAHLRSLAETKMVACELDGTVAGGSGRPVGICRIDGRDLGLAQIEAGHARDCPAFSGGRYADAEKIASATRNLALIYPLPDYCRVGG
jgi:endonuclease YncB( thermonuclease family)